MIRTLLAAIVIVSSAPLSPAGSTPAGDLDTYATCIGAYVQKRGDQIGVGAAVKLGVRRCQKWTTGLDKAEVEDMERYITVQAYNAACRETPEARACK